MLSKAAEVDWSVFKEAALRFCIREIQLLGLLSNYICIGDISGQYYA